jgi:energy-coupling factor transport system ATP-binding protein
VAVDEVIRVRDLWWRYELGQDWALKGIDLTVRRGEFLVIVGPSGAGKSTLCLTLCGMIPHFSRGYYKGEVMIIGRETRKMKLSEITRKVGIVFQDPDTQFVTMSVEDEIAFPLENHGVPRQEMIERVRRTMEITRIIELKDKYPHELSGGQKQRVAIASILALEPEILILDEPTSDLDPVGKSEVFSMLAELKRAGRTIILVEHNTEEAAKYADRVVLLRDGKIIMEGPPRKVFEEVESIKSAGVYPPQVTELAYTLSTRYGVRGELPITLEECLEWLRELNARIVTPNRLERSPTGVKGESIISLKDVSYSYPDGTAALRDVTLEFARGEFTAIIGQNGSGKTTLVKHIVGLLRPTVGEVRIFGKKTSEMSIKEIATKVGYVYQNPDHQLFCQTVYEECAYGLRNLGLSEPEIRRRVSEILGRVGLQGLEKVDTFLLGKGQRQRLAIASTLVMNPEVIIVDEPTTGQDMSQSTSIMELLASLHREGRTVLIVTHNMRLVAEYAERVVVMQAGRVVLDGDVRTVFSQVEKLREALITPPQITQLGQLLSGDSVTPLTVEEMADMIRLGDA